LSATLFEYAAPEGVEKLVVEYRGNSAIIEKMGIARVYREIRRLDI